MRTTVNIRDSLLQRLKVEAERSGLSLTEWVNRAIEKGLERLSPQADVPTYQCLTFSMGQANFNPDKALNYAADLEDAGALGWRNNLAGKITHEAIPLGNRSLAVKG